MIPPLIVTEALNHQINLIAITDHNSTANITSVQKAALGTGLVVLPGMELQTREEVHSLCIFDTLEQAAELQLYVDQNLPDIQNRPDFFGEQFVVDETGDFLRREERLLLCSSTISLEQAWRKVKDLGGLFIPAHVNRKGFGLIANLGFVPPGISFDALEISRHLEVSEVPIKFPQIAGYPLIQSGDVHGLDEFLGANELIINQPTIHEISLALQHLEGRSLKIRMN